MNFNRTAVVNRLKTGDFNAVFREHLGWDNFPNKLDVSVDGQMHALTGVAEKRGLAVYLYRGIPGRPTRLKIDQQVAKSSKEHLIIYAEGDFQQQIWQWVRREPGKPQANREQTFNAATGGEVLLQKLNALTISLADEEMLGGVTAVAGMVKSAFDVDKVTKRFYDGFKAQRDAFAEFLRGIPDEAMQAWYVSVMLNRLMFIYFIQKKGFLDNDSAYLRTKLAESQKKGKDLYYADFLCPLFFEGFAKKADDRGAGVAKLLGSIPYLNGGLFLRHQIEEQFGRKIEITDAAFEKIFDFFDAYQWNLDERPLRGEKEINPDVLGYIFEKYINQKQMGAYYTKEDITEYISKNTIIPFLFDAAEPECRNAFASGSYMWKLLADNPDRYIYDAVRHGVINEDGTVLALPPEIEIGITEIPQRGGWNKPAPEPYALPTETWREHVARRQRCLEIREKLRAGEVHEINELITLNLDIRQFAQDVISQSEGPELVRAFYAAIERVTVLDPTCGSGAFLFAALNILQPLYDACLERMETCVADAQRGISKDHPAKFTDFARMLSAVEKHHNHNYFVLKSIIVNNLFGVDIMEEAVEICKLRLFLKLVAQVETVQQIEPLPDIDFNIRCGNTLVGYAKLDDFKKSLPAMSGFADDAVTRIEEKAQKVDLLFGAFRGRQTSEISPVSGSLAAQQKRAILDDLKSLRDELDQFLAKDYLQTSPAKFAKWRQTHQPFHWCVEFFGILKRGGFDVIIGNPPYVEYKNVKPVYTVLTPLYRSLPAANLYAICLERCTKLLKEGCRLGAIVPSGLMGLDDACSLRTVLQEALAGAHFSTYAIRPGKLFDGVDQRLCIVIGRARRGPGALAARTTRYHHWNAVERETLLRHLSYATPPPSFRLQRFPQIGGETAAGIFSKIEGKANHTISDYYAVGDDGFLMHYHRSPRYWIRGMDFQPYFKSGSRERSIHHFRDLRFISVGIGKTVGAILNSSLFFFWFITVGNGRNLTGIDVEQFPVGALPNKLLDGVPSVFDSLMADYRGHAIIRRRQDCEYEEFRPSQSKAIIDAIDGLLSRYYGLTDEEADFLANFEIKYRVGGEAEGEGE